MKKDWDILISYENETIKTKYKKNIYKKRIPTYVRMLIALLIFCIVYVFMRTYMKDLSQCIYDIVSVALAALGYITTSYKDYKNKIFNEVYNKGEENENINVR